MHRKIKIILNPMADMGNAWRGARVNLNASTHIRF